MIATRLLAAFVLASCLAAQDSQPAEPKLPELHFATGKVTLGANLATLDVPPGFLFLGQKEARKVVEDVWENPPDPDTIGLVLPEAGRDLRSWGVIVSYEDSGHVKDEDAASLDFDKLLKSIQEDQVEGNKERQKRGYPTVQLLGWAERPHYDSAAKKLYWAKRARFGNSPEETLNYDVRILGRRGVLVLTAVGEVSELATIAQGCKAILAGTHFTSGNRYEDFDSNIDKVAAYGIGGLIAGKLLLKGGLLKVLLKPLIAVGVIVAGFAAKLFGRKKKAQPAT